MKNIKKFICFFMISIISINLFTGCALKEEEVAVSITKDIQTTQSTQTTTESNNTGITLNFGRPMGVYVLKSSAEEFQDAYSEVLTFLGEIRNGGEKAPAKSITTTPTQQTVTLHEDFKLTDSIEIFVTEEQQPSFSMTLSYGNDHMHLGSKTATYYEITMDSRHAHIKDVRGDLKYGFKTIDSNNQTINMSLEIEVDEMSDINIVYENNEYIITSNKGMIQITGASTSNMKIDLNMFDHKSQELRVYFEEDGTLTLK